MVDRMACREANDLLNPAVEKTTTTTTDEQRPGSYLDEAHLVEGMKRFRGLAETEKWWPIVKAAGIKAD